MVAALPVAPGAQQLNLTLTIINCLMFRLRKGTKRKEKSYLQQLEKKMIKLSEFLASELNKKNPPKSNKNQRTKKVSHK